MLLNGATWWLMIDTEGSFIPGEPGSRMWREIGNVSARSDGGGVGT